tara:strand:- start:4332 stop:4466 length:135 start_codon:yes stop_codon:yes gene_type:complete
MLKKRLDEWEKKNGRDNPNSNTNTRQQSGYFFQLFHVVKAKRPI